MALACLYAVSNRCCLPHRVLRAEWTVGCGVRLAEFAAVTERVASCPGGLGKDENGALMIIRAKQVLPGMFMALLLSNPVMAAAADVEKPVGVSTPKEIGAVISASRVKAGSKAVQSVDLPDRRRVVAASTAHTPGSMDAKLRSGNDRLIRKAGASVSRNLPDRNLIDDGTLWRERGSVATWQQTGMASWYGGEQWQGHRTSSGSRFDQNELTAAHATLPLGTKVRVTSHSGARSVIVTINDRPGTRTRIIDLSRQAAKELGILDSGVAMVTLQPM